MNVMKWSTILVFTSSINKSEVYSKLLNKKILNM